jgi:zinc transport system permease protein
LFEAFQFEFVQRVLLTGLLASVACGVIGTYVVVKRIVFISGGISHASLGGVGLAYYLGAPLLLGAVGFSLLSALVLGLASTNRRLEEDTLIGTIWSVGMALGIVFLSASRGYVVDPNTFLFGNILLVSWTDVLTILLLDLLILGTVWLLYKEFLAITLDEEFAQLRGLPVQGLYLVLLCLVALTVVVMIKVVGIILVVALLSIPPAIARWFTSRLHVMMLIACLLGAAFIGAGIFISFQTNWPSGASIVLTSAAAYGAIAFGRRLSHRTSL